MTQGAFEPLLGVDRYTDAGRLRADDLAVRSWAAEQLARATDPAVRRALSAIAEDESRHAELAWRTVAWAIERGGEAVRVAVASVLEDAARYVPGVAADTAIPAEILGSHGRLDPATAREAMVRALDEVVRPCFASLLQAPRRADVVASAAA